MMATKAMISYRPATGLSEVGSLWLDPKTSLMEMCPCHSDRSQIEACWTCRAFLTRQVLSGSGAINTDTLNTSGEQCGTTKRW